MGRLDGKVVVVTGGASGIGRATAVCSAAEGARVVTADVQEIDAMTAGSFDRWQITAHRADVSQAADVAELVRWTAAERGRFDVLVNAAGISGGSAMTADYPETTFDRVIATNLKGVFLCMKHALMEMLRSGGGAIVNIASILGLVGMPQTPAYAAAKGAVIQLTRTAAIEYAHRNIRVNCLCPGVIDTPMTPAAARPALIDCQPVGRLGRAEEVAAAAVFLASDASAFTTGAVLAVDGGFTAQ